MSTKLATRLLLSRRDLRWNQDELAAKSNISRQYISDLERSRISNPGIEVIQALAQALDIKPEYLAGWTDDPLGEGETVSSISEGRVVYQVGSPGEYRALQELLDLWHELSDEDQHFILDLAAKLRRVNSVRIVE